MTHKVKTKKKKKRNNIVYPLVAIGVLGITAHAIAKTTQKNEGE